MYRTQRKLLGIKHGDYQLIKNGPFFQEGVSGKKRKQSVTERANTKKSARKAQLANQSFLNAIQNKIDAVEAQRVLDGQLPLHSRDRNQLQAELMKKSFKGHKNLKNSVYHKTLTNLRTQKREAQKYRNVKHKFNKIRNTVGTIFLKDYDFLKPYLEMEKQNGI